MNIIDNSDLRKYRTEVPNIVDDMDISVYAFRLYVHIKRVGTCWQSTRTLAEKCKMSVGKISDAKKELESAGLITIKRSKSTTESDTLYVVDIWGKNFAHFSDDNDRSPHERTCSPHERTCSPHERTCSPHEPKKEPFKNKPIEESSSLVPLESTTQDNQDLAIADDDDEKSLAFANVPDFSSTTTVEPPPAGPPVPDDDTGAAKLLSKTLQHVGVGLTAYIVDRYMDLVEQFGIRAVVTGIENAANNHKQHRFAYVEKCILTAVEGGLGRMKVSAPQSQLDFSLDEVLL
jgi:hypothetical protein